MPDRYLRHKPTGVVYIWQLVFAENPDFEEYDPNPEIDIKIPTLDTLVPDKTPKPIKGARAGLQPSSVSPEEKDAALSADASRNLP